MSVEPVLKESPKPGCPLLMAAVVAAAGVLGGGFAWLLTAVR